MLKKNFTKDQLEEMMAKETALGKIRAILNGDEDVEPYCNFTLYDLCETALALYDELDNIVRGYIPQGVAIELVGFLEKAGCGKPGKPNTIWSMVQEIISERDQWINGFIKMADSDEAECKERVHWQTRAEKLEKILEAILDDGTGDTKEPGKRLWPLRADNYRTARRLLDEK